MSPLIPSILLLFVLVLQAQAAPPIREAGDDQSPLKMKRRVITSAERKAEKDLLDLLNETESKNKREAGDYQQTWKKFLALLAARGEYSFSSDPFGIIFSQSESKM